MNAAHCDLKQSPETKKNLLRRQNCIIWWICNILTLDITHMLIELCGSGTSWDMKQIWEFFPCFTALQPTLMTLKKTRHFLLACQTQISWLQLCHKHRSRDDVPTADSSEVQGQISRQSLSASTLITEHWIHWLRVAHIFHQLNWNCFRRHSDPQSEQRIW